MLASLLAALTVIPTHVWIRQGPVLAGSRVVWTSEGPAVYASAPVRRLWRAGSADITDLAASASRIAFIRRSDLWVGPPFHSIGAARSVDVVGKTVAYTQTVSGESRVVAENATVATSGNAEYSDVAIAGHYVAWIAYFTRTCPAPTPFRLVVKTLADRTVADGVTIYGGFDLDGRRLAYLKSPKEIAVTRLR